MNILDARQALAIAHEVYVLVRGANRLTDTGRGPLADPKSAVRSLGG